MKKRNSLMNNGCFWTFIVSMVITVGFWWFVVWAVAKALNFINSVIL